MPRRVLSLVVGAIAFGAAGIAFASPQFASTFAGTYSSQIPNSPSGLDALATWSDPGEPGGKPKEVQKIKVVFAPGTRLDTSALPVCRASDEEVQIRGRRACPSDTQLGFVEGKGVSGGGGTPFNTFATLFNARREIIVVVNLDDKRGRLLTNFRDDVQRSSITVNLKISKGISLTRFQAHVPRHLRKRGGKRRAYMTTPPLARRAACGPRQ